MLQTIDFKGPRQINAAASFFRYESAALAGDATIRVRADGQDLGTYLPGDSLELPRVCATWEIVPAVEGMAGVVRLGVGRVESVRLVGSDLSVADQGMQRAKAGRVFSVGRLTAVSSGYGYCGIANPAGSGLSVVLRRAVMVGGSGGAGNVPSLFVASGVVGAQIGVGVPHKVGGAVSVALVTEKVVGALPGDDPTLAYWVGRSELSAVWEPSEPLIVPPGFTVYARSQSGASLFSSFTWSEEVV